MILFYGKLFSVSKPANDRYEQMPIIYGCGKSGFVLPLDLLIVARIIGSVDYPLTAATDMIKYAFSITVLPSIFWSANITESAGSAAEVNFRSNLENCYRDEMIISSGTGHDMWVLSDMRLIQSLTWTGLESIWYLYVTLWWSHPWSKPFIDWYCEAKGKACINEFLNILPNKSSCCLWWWQSR